MTDRCATYGRGVHLQKAGEQFCGGQSQRPVMALSVPARVPRIRCRKCVKKCLEHPLPGHFRGFAVLPQKAFLVALAGGKDGNSVRRLTEDDDTLELGLEGPDRSAVLMGSGGFGRISVLRLFLHPSGSSVSGQRSDPWARPAREGRRRSNGERLDNCRLLSCQCLPARLAAVNVSRRSGLPSLLLLLRTGALSASGGSEKKLNIGTGRRKRRNGFILFLERYCQPQLTEQLT